MRIQFQNGQAVITNVTIDQATYAKAGAALKAKFGPTLGKLTTDSSANNPALSNAERDVAIVRAKRSELIARRNAVLAGGNPKTLVAVDGEIAATDVATAEAESILAAAKEIAEQSQSAGAEQRAAREGTVIGEMRQAIEAELTAAETELGKAIAPHLARLAALTDGLIASSWSAGTVQNWLTN